MAKNKFGLDFDGFLELAKQIDEMGEGYLKEATNNALQKSKDYANGQIVIAMSTSPYAFIKGKQSSSTNRPATGKAVASVTDIMKNPVLWDGSVAKAYIGADLKIAPEAIILAMGTPHIKPDTKLKNALKVKGAIRKEVSRIQQEEFLKVMKEANKNG